MYSPQPPRRRATCWDPPWVRQPQPSGWKPADPQYGLPDHSNHFPNLYQQPHQDLPRPLTCWDPPQARQPYCWEPPTPFQPPPPAQTPRPTCWDPPGQRQSLGIPAYDHPQPRQPSSWGASISCHEQPSCCSPAAADVRQPPQLRASSSWFDMPQQHVPNSAPTYTASANSPAATTQGRSCHEKAAVVLQPLLSPTSLCHSAIVSMPAAAPILEFSVVDEAIHEAQPLQGQVHVSHILNVASMPKVQPIPNNEAVMQYLPANDPEMPILDEVRTDELPPIGVIEEEEGSIEEVKKVVVLFDARVLSQDVIENCWDKKGGAYLCAFVGDRVAYGISKGLKEIACVYVELHVSDVASMNHRSTSLDADARLIPPRIDTSCLSILGRIDKLSVLALNNHDHNAASESAMFHIQHGSPLVIFEGNDEGRRSAIRCAFDPGGDTSSKLLFATLFVVSWFPP